MFPVSLCPVRQLDHCRLGAALLPVQRAAAQTNNEATGDLPESQSVVSSEQKTRPSPLLTDSGERPGVFRVLDALGGPRRGSSTGSLFGMNNQLFKATQLSPATDGIFFRGDDSSRGLLKARSSAFAADDSLATADTVSRERGAPAGKRPTDAYFDEISLEADGGEERRELQQDRRHTHPPKSMRDVSKRLLELHSCVRDSDCFGDGRRCIERRCWGFAGPESRPFLCRVGNACHLRLKGHFYGEGGQAGNGVFALRVVKGESYTACGLSPGRGIDDAGLIVESQHDQHSTVQLETLPHGVSARGHTPASTLGEKTSFYELEEDPSGVCPAEGHRHTGDCPLFGSEPIPKQTTAFTTSKYILGEPGDQTEEAFTSTADRRKQAHHSSPATDGLQSPENLRCTYESGLRPQAECTVKLGSELLSRLNVGTYTLCGCSGTDLTGQGEACSAVEDFAVPVGRLVIAGFTPRQARLPHENSPALQRKREKESPADQGSYDSSDPETALAGGQVQRVRISSSAHDAGDNVDSSGSVFTEDGVVRTFVCTVGNVCELSKMWGVGLDAGSFYVEALPGEQLDRCEGLRGDASVLTEVRTEGTSMRSRSLHEKARTVGCNRKQTSVDGTDCLLRTCPNLDACGAVSCIFAPTSAKYASRRGNVRTRSLVAFHFILKAVGTEEVVCNSAQPYV